MNCYFCKNITKYVGNDKDHSYYGDYYCEPCETYSFFTKDDMATVISPKGYIYDLSNETPQCIRVYPVDPKGVMVISMELESSPKTSDELKILGDRITNLIAFI